VAVLETRDNLRFPADVYLEGGDQFRGWFNSSLMCGLAAHDQAPYKEIITYGWVVDGEGKQMHKSGGNAVSPNEVMKQSGAEILRLWAATMDVTEDVRVSDEILKRIADSYRKMRNTLRYALGNLDGFDPETDSVVFDEMQELDRWALASLEASTAKILQAYEAYNFQAATKELTSFMNVTLSARYFDIIKDRLYTAAPKSPARRSAQTALFKIADALCRLLSPILVFTSDEAWENLPNQKLGSVHVAVFPTVTPASRRLSSERLAHSESDEELSAEGLRTAAPNINDGGDTLLTDWERIFAVRDEVLKALEEARSEKLIGSGLEARVILTADENTFAFLQKYRGELRYIFIVSQVELLPGDALKVEVKKADGAKCERCWNYSTRVGESQGYPTACERCVEALSEIQKAARV